ncbi:hypothetical protein [Serratia surfactantfaciens]|uniref:Lysozyme inhibitor LprI N-terminal domain-containing protein n=1 Tax=Serratia surfactantfaciens TaxID=2741499 RepID=A0ABS0LWP8_9GAMM|nr:hypothetical protein [Serratia surfactantfaciens]MBH1919717.1 hypothetical protein [Serratia surfactantfaciens]
MKLPSLIAVALAMLASFYSQAFVDRHSPVTVPVENAPQAGCPASMAGLLQHLWLVEQIQAERVELARLRAERDAVKTWLKTQKNAKRTAVAHLPSPSTCAQHTGIVRCLSLRLRRASALGPHRPFVGAYCHAWLNGRPQNC